MAEGVLESLTTGRVKGTAEQELMWLLKSSTLRK